MKFKGQGKINICGFEYKKILQTAVGGVSEHPKNLFLESNLDNRPIVEF